jgi:hypothetical protein
MRGGAFDDGEATLVAGSAVAGSAVAGSAVAVVVAVVVAICVVTAAGAPAAEAVHRSGRRRTVRPSTTHEGMQPGVTSSAGGAPASVTCDAGLTEALALSPAARACPTVSEATASSTRWDRCDFGVGVFIRLG